jgi:small subunit ribosomal protein S17
MSGSARGTRKAVIGTVVSNRMQKTIAVEAQRQVRDPRYGKYVRKATRLYAHDEKGEAQVGDSVELVETRPLSKTKRWRLVRVVARAVGGGEAVPGEVQGK